MNKLGLRIISKLGLLIFIIGFFMPVSCNQNGFQIAQTLEALGGMNLISLSLYAIFIFSCIGLFLLILLLKNINYKIMYDWINLFLIIALYVVLIISHMNKDSDSFFSNFQKLQSGAYVMLLGILITLLSLLLKPSNIINKTINDKELNDVYDNNIENEECIDYNEFDDDEKQIIKLTENRAILTYEYILENTNLDLTVVENIIKDFINIGLLKDIYTSFGEHVFYYTKTNIKNLDNDFLILLKKFNYDDDTLEKIYEKITENSNYDCKIYIGKLYYIYNKHGTENEWKKIGFEFKREIDKLWKIICINIIKGLGILLGILIGFSIFGRLIVGVKGYDKTLDILGYIAGINMCLIIIVPLIITIISEIKIDKKIDIWKQPNIQKGEQR